MTDFKAQVGAVIHGRYSASGTAYLYLHQDHGHQRRQGTELHEWVHSELLDNTAYGRFQQMLHIIMMRAPPGAFRKRCAELFEISMAACAVAHEGLAAYRELCWLASNEGGESAAEFLDALPVDYLEGVEQVTRLLGNPFDEPYQGLTPPEFHTLLITLGSALLNTPILADYTDTDRIFEEPLNWLLLDGPDERLGVFHERAEAFAEALRSLTTGPLQEATNTFLASNATEPLERFWDLGVETLRQPHPDLPMLTKLEVDRDVTAFNASWIERLNQEAGRTIAVRDPKHVDIGNERSLNMRLYPADYGQIETRTAENEAVPVKFDVMLETAKSLRSPSVAYMGLLTHRVPNPSLEDFLMVPIGLFGTPMRTISRLEESPWVSSMHSVVAETTMEEFLAASAALVELGWCWYTNQTIVIFLREIGRQPEGLLFCRCADARHVLQGLEHAGRHGAESQGYYIGQTEGEESLVAVILDRVVLFSITTVMGTSSFIEAVSALGLARLEDFAFQVGPHRVNLNVAARWMLWAALGR